MKKKSIMVLLVSLFIYIGYLFCSREFYIIRGVPITMYDNYIILGRWYCGLLRPKNNYIKFAPYASYPIVTLHSAENVSICASKDDTEINLKDFKCVYYEDPTTIPSVKYKNNQKKNPFLFSVNLWWDWGTFFYQIIYMNDPNSYKYIEHGGFWRWHIGTQKSSE